MSHDSVLSFHCRLEQQGTWRQRCSSPGSIWRTLSPLNRLMSTPWLLCCGRSLPGVMPLEVRSLRAPHQPNNRVARQYQTHRSSLCPFYSWHLEKRDIVQVLTCVWISNLLKGTEFYFYEDSGCPLRRDWIKIS